MFYGGIWKTRVSPKLYNIWFTCTHPHFVQKKFTHLNGKLEKEEHIHTRSCILVLYFWDISANEHQKWKHKKWNVSGLHMKKWNTFFFFLYIYLLLQMYFFRCTMQIYDCTSIPHYSPELFHRALLTSNRKEKSQKYSMHVYFSHILINLLNSLWLFRDCSYSKRTSLCDKKRPILRLDIFPHHQ